MGTEVDGNAISHYWSVLTLEKGYGLFFWKFRCWSLLEFYLYNKPPKCKTNG